MSAFTAHSDEHPWGSADARVRSIWTGSEQTVAVVIPALNEAKTIGPVVSCVPRGIAGVGRVEVIVVDDGSTDTTQLVALAAGADHVARHRRTRGLVATFCDGIDAALRTGADIIVHLDGDGQHDPAAIPRLIAPILEGSADVVVGVRQFSEADGLSSARRRGNQLGSWLFRRMVKLPISDATSGYRAFSREALQRLSVNSGFTYTLETLIRAARLRFSVAEVVVPALPRVEGRSRMTRSVTRYIGHAGGQAFRTLLYTNPLTVFGRAALVMLAASALLTGWFLLGYQSGGMHLPALLAALVSLVLATGFFLCGLIADGITTSHRLLEETLYRLRRIEQDGTLSPYGLSYAEEEIGAFARLRSR